MTVKYANGGDVPRAMGADPFASEQYFADKGLQAALRQAGRKENRMANRMGRKSLRETGQAVYPAPPTDAALLLNLLENPNTTRERMVNKGFRNEAGRMLAKGLGTAALATGVGEYMNTPKQITRPQGAFGQPIPINLSPTQRIAMMLGLGPF